MNILKRLSSSVALFFVKLFGKMIFNIPYNPRKISIETMYSPALKAFYLVTYYDTGEMVTERIRGQENNESFILALRHQEPILVFKGRKPTNKELDLIELLYKL